MIVITSPWQAVILVDTLGTRLILAFGCKFTRMVVVAGKLHPEIGFAVNFNKTNPFAISLTDGVKVGVSVVAFVNVPGVPDTPVILVHNKLLLLETVTKSGSVNVSPHIEITFDVVEIAGFWLIVIVIASVTATCWQFELGNTDMVKVTLEVSLVPNI